MIHPTAPFFADVADAPAGGAAHWITTEDGKRLRLWVRPADKGVGPGGGTVLLFPGRTEYIEKYGRAARDLAARGFAVAVIDWRGQGLSDRLLPDPITGHINDFGDYQRDVRALLPALRSLDMPRPWHLIAHSMGGAIGLRALHEGLGVRAAVFSAPMWGIQLTRIMRPIAWGMGWIHHGIGRSGRPAMRRSEQLYVLDTAFEENFLTRDKEMFRYMRAQIQAHPELGIGGPSMGWAYAALRECRALARLPSPAIPALCYLGTQEKIVDPLAIRQRMARWKNGVLHELEGAEHEIMMEEEAVRTRFFDQVAAHFRTHA